MLSHRPYPNFGYFKISKRAYIRIQISTFNHDDCTSKHYVNRRGGWYVAPSAYYRNLVKEIDVDLKDIKKLEKDIREYFKVVGGYFPKGTSSKARCIDCCYKNVCIK